MANGRTAPNEIIGTVTANALPDGLARPFVIASSTRWDGASSCGLTLIARQSCWPPTTSGVREPSRAGIPLERCNEQRVAD
jgi:hypothetical protein